MNLIIQYGLLELVLGLGLGFILYCTIWRSLALPYMCPQPRFYTEEARRDLIVSILEENEH